MAHLGLAAGSTAIARNRVPLRGRATPPSFSIHLSYPAGRRQRHGDTRGPAESRRAPHITAHVHPGRGEGADGPGANGQCRRIIKQGTTTHGTAYPRHGISASEASDASGSWGCGAWYGRRWFQLQWDPVSSPLSIMEKELLPIVLACAIWGPSWRAHYVTVHCDNQAVVACLRSRTSRDAHIMHMLRVLAFVEALSDFSLTPTYISTHDNHLADDLSRNNHLSFLSKVPGADRQGTPLPMSLLGLLLEHPTLPGTPRPQGPIDNAHPETRTGWHRAGPPRTRSADQDSPTYHSPNPPQNQATISMCTPSGTSSPLGGLMLRVLRVLSPGRTLASIPVILQPQTASGLGGHGSG